LTISLEEEGVFKKCYLSFMEVALQREYRHSGHIHNQKRYNDPFKPHGLTEDPRNNIKSPRNETESDKPTRQDPTEQDSNTCESNGCTERDTIWTQSILFEELDGEGLSFQNGHRNGVTESCFPWQEQQ
jgi:hypothetical protein